MSKIVIIGAGAMGSAFSLPCLDNNHDVNIVGTHLENDFIDDFQANENLHAGLKTKIPQEIKVFKFDKFDQVLKSNVDLIVLGISSKGIEWVADQLIRVYSGKLIPNLLMLTKGLSIHKNNYELLVDKLQRLLLEKGITKTPFSFSIPFFMFSGSFVKGLGLQVRHAACSARCVRLYRILRLHYHTALICLGEAKTLSN